MPIQIKTNCPHSPQWRSLHVSDRCLKKVSNTITTSSSTISSLGSPSSIFASIPFCPKSTLILPCLISLFTKMQCKENLFLTTFLFYTRCRLYLYWARDDSWREGYKGYQRSKIVEQKDKPIQNSLQEAASRVWGVDISFLLVLINILIYLISSPVQWVVLVVLLGVIVVIVVLIIHTSDLPVGSYLRYNWNLDLNMSKK